MSKLIRLAAKSGKMNKEACLMALREKANKGSGFNGFTEIYLSDAYSLIGEYITPGQFAGYLSALKADGLYKSDGENKDFGYVKLAA